MIYIDTGAFLARYSGRDQHHKESVRSWEKLEKASKRCFTSNFVLNETFTLLARRAGYVFAVERARHIFSSEALTILRPLEEDERDAVKFFGKYADQEVSFTDCVSFVLMRKKNIEIAFSFDAHFQRAGFRLW